MHDGSQPCPEDHSGKFRSPIMVEKSLTSANSLSHPCKGRCEEGVLRLEDSLAYRRSSEYPFDLSLAYWVSWSAVTHLVLLSEANATGTAS